MLRLVKSKDICYEDLGKIESEFFGKTYIQDIIRSRPRCSGKSCDYKDIDAEVREHLKEYNWGELFVLCKDPFSPALRLSKEDGEEKWVLNSFYEEPTFFSASLESLIKNLKPSPPRETNYDPAPQINQNQVETLVKVPFQLGS